MLPVMLLGAAWWIVAEFALAPRAPTNQSTARACLDYLAHPKGFPRLSQSEKEGFLRRLTARGARDAAFLESMMSELRRSEPDLIASLRDHLFAALKPVLMADVDHYLALDASSRQKFLDERIVEYNRLGAFVGQMRLEKSVSKGMPRSDPREWLAWLMSNTTESERERGSAYMAALAARISVINDDAVLKGEFEERIRRATVGAEGP